MALRSVDIDLGAGLDETRVVVLLHGFGASAQDLVPLAGELGVFRRWLFPGAPFPIRVQGMSYGSAWFPRSDQEVEKAVYGSYFRNLRAMEPDGLAAAANEVGELVETAGADPSRLVLGGFSQGAMVCAEYLRQAAAADRPFPAGVLLFSGALIAERWWKALPKPDPGHGFSAQPLPPVVQSHGTGDSVLPFSEGEALRDCLREVGFSVEFVSFAGGHEIDRAALVAAEALFSGVSAKK